MGEAQEEVRITTTSELLALPIPEVGEVVVVFLMPGEHLGLLVQEDQAELFSATREAFQPQLALQVAPAMLRMMFTGTITSMALAPSRLFGNQHGPLC